MKLRAILSAFLLVFALYAASMTDDEVLNYIRTQSANGKTDQEIGIELKAKGVTAGQMQRIRAKYNKEGSTAVGTTESAKSATPSDRARHSVEETVAPNAGGVLDDAVSSESKRAPEVFGHEIFNSRALTFEPSRNLATPKNYRLGPGDEVVIDLWGASEEHLREMISPEGSIMISRLGPVHLNGKTIDEANAYIKQLFTSKYGGLGDDQTDISVTLGNIRSIQIDIMGEVNTPGSFRMSPFSTVFHALYNAGGINDIGSMRNVYVLRNGKRIANIDIYDYIFKGKQTGNIRLQEGDVIIVPPYEQIVNISGNVKRPMLYEIKQGETVESLLDYAGGFSGNAYSGMVRLSRQNGEENELYNIDKGEFATYRLQDGDVLTVGEVLDRFSNRVELKGAVKRPGLYALGSGTTTVADLIGKADGLTEDAYKGRALIYREGPDLSLQVIPIDIAAIEAGYEPDVELKKNDIIEISSLQTLKERGDFTIDGAVTNPGPYSYMENTTVEDLVIRAGGLREGASTARIDIARRIVNPAEVTETQQLAEIFTVDLYAGLDKKRNTAGEFILKPYDRVTVRTAPGYAPQQQVSINGEVVFPGAYTLQKRNERISELVARSGGIVEGAYLKGASLKRHISENERLSRENVIRMALQNQVGTDSISNMKINVADFYSVGINLPMALANPGSEYDIVLQAGDELFIPEQQSTVKISGDVMYPNITFYEPGRKVNYYVDQAGGYGVTAKKSKCFIVYMNGQVARVGRSTVVDPGAHIIVPSKRINDASVWERIIPIISGIGSTAMMAASIASILK